MSSIELLDKTRKINKLLHSNRSRKLVFNDICSVMSEVLNSNILIISKKGKVLGLSTRDDIEEITELIEDRVGGFVDTLFNERLLSVLSTKENVNLLTLGFGEGYSGKYQGIICPVEIAGKRLGSMFIYSTQNDYDIEDIILAEYGAVIVGLEMSSALNEESQEETRKSGVVRSAFKTLSSSELLAIQKVFEELDGNDGLLVASKIADDIGITRSVIVNALRKFESAGLIMAKSSGMRGTYIKVLNDMLYEELDRINQG
jgi:transcriptional pleiotropic repressor